MEHFITFLKSDKRFTNHFRIFMLVAFLVYSQQATAQGNLGLNLSFGSEPTLSDQWANGGTSGKYWAMEYDPCEAKLKVLMYLYDNGSSSEVEELVWQIREGGTVISELKYFWAQHLGGMTTQVAPLTVGTIVSYSTSGNIEGFRLFDHNNRAYMEFTWYLPKEGDPFSKDYNIYTDVEWDESGFNDRANFLIDLGQEKLAVQSGVPLVTRTTVGDNEKAMNISFSFPEACNADYEDNKGPFYEVLRYENNDLTNAEVLTTARVPKNSSPVAYKDQGNGFDPCTDYAYAIRAVVYNTDGRIEQETTGNSPFFSYTTILDEPEAITASTNSCDGAITLSWQQWADSDTPTGFRVERKLPDIGSVFEQLDTLISAQATSYVDSISSVYEGLDIQYRIRTENECGQTEVSGLSTVTGNIIKPLETPANVTASVITSGDSRFIRLRWDDKSTSENKFLITRQFKEGGGLVTYEVDANVVSFDDKNISVCQPYRYEVSAVNDCATDGVSDPDEAVTIVLEADLSEVIQPGALVASRGYFKDRVTLNWTVGGESGSIDRYKLFSRPLGSDQIPVLAGVVSGNERSFDDNKTEAGQLLEYFLIGETDCGENVLTTSDNENLNQATFGFAKAVGFRSPQGVINGNISFSGGNAVKDVKVIVESSSGVLGKALSFDGDDIATISDEAGRLVAGNSQLSLSLYLKSDHTNLPASSGTVLQKADYYRLLLSNQGFVTFEVYDGTDWQGVSTTAELDDTRYVHINADYDGTTARIYLDGELQESADFSVDLSASNVNPVLIGVGLMGEIDEISVWNRVRTADEILRDHVRLLNTEEDGMIGYWPLNVGTGDQFFDGSKEGNSFNGRDGIIDGATWTDDIPTLAQLSTLGFTDAEGNYTINGVKYRGEGENFKVTPLLGVHQFSPSQKAIFIGEGNLVQNGVDFEDISSFKVTGRVVFGYKNLGVGSEGVGVFIDGQPVILEGGKLLTTDQYGNFEVDVPIGQHYLEVRKDNHIFLSEGRFPVNEALFNFNEPISGMIFTDETTRKLIGKVVGGTREGDKAIGFNKTVNNLGEARFTLRSTDGLIEELVTTDAVTGEYSMELPPKVYNLIDHIDESIGNIRIAGSGLRFTTGSPQIDLASEYNPSAERDTVKFVDEIPLPDGVIVVDTVDNNTRQTRAFEYDFKVNHIYRKAAEIFVYDGIADGQRPFLGSESYEVITRQDTAVVPLLGSNDEYLFNYPVLLQNRVYTLKIAVNEVYTNKDGAQDVIDNVPVTDAKLLLENDMMLPFYQGEEGVETYPLENGVPVLQLSEADGDTLIRFRTLEPEFSANADPALSYTRRFKLTVLAGGNVVSWPNAQDQTESFPVYILGDRSTNNASFISSGPDVVKHIIRDPYGGESFAYLEKGSTISSTSSFNLVNDEVASGEIAFGFKAFDVKVAATGGFELQETYDSTGNVTTEITTLERIETRPDAQEVGAGGDLYISESKTFVTGFADRLKLFNKKTCENAATITCLPQSPEIVIDDETYVLAKTFAPTLASNGEKTVNVFSQNHILNVLIPDLINLRNGLLSNPDPTAKYASNLPVTHPLYGSNNDDPRWALVDNESNQYVYEEDHDGLSYTFEAADNNDRDSVAWLNQQIRLWREAIARNEQEKLDASEAQADDKENISLSAGARVIREEQTVDTRSYEVTYGNSTAFSKGFEIDADPDLGFTFNLAANVTVNEVINQTTVTDTTSYTTFGYELFEPDVGDFISMDVVKGINSNGPIFILKGGETSCPHEEAVTTLFHEPGTVIGKTTFQRDKPRLEVEVSTLYNVPADGQASFNLTLHNESESKDDFIFTMFIIDETNPDGAVISMDGEFFDRNREIFVPGGSSIRKTVTIQRGPEAYDYEDIRIVLASTCQSDPTDFERIIADTVSVSTRFLPVCTTPEILSPTDNWTLNNRFDNKLLVEIGDFDINFPGFEFLQLEYKASEASGWIPIQKFYRDLEASGNPADGMDIPKTGASFAYEWDISTLDLPDGGYDLRVVSDCEILGTGGRVDSESGIKSGVIDRINPHAFGSPQPGDGILSPGDEISIQFNEPINTAVGPQNFVMTGVLNGADLNHNVSLHFDGTGSGSVSLNNSPNLRRRTFTIDFWAKRNGTGNEVILHQGASDTELLQIGFNSSDQLFFNMNGELFQTAIAIVDNLWNHYSFAYNEEQDKVDIFVATGSQTFTESKEGFVVDYQVAETITLGKSTLGDALPFNGFLHELRIWSRVFSEAETAVNRNTVLGASTVGLLANWPFEEGRGTVGLDKVKSRQAEVNTAWRIDPAGSSMSMNGSTSYLESNGVADFTNEQDFTIEMWFKTGSQDAMALFSTGKGDLTDDNTGGWTIGIEAGSVFLETNGERLKNPGLNLADGQWHHLALVIDRLTNTTLLIDGEPRGAIKSSRLGAFSGDKFWYGRRGWKEAGIEMSDQYFEGQIDEFRLWTTARKLREVSFSRYNKLNGDELGLRLYYPFENFTLQAGVYLPATDLSNNANGEDAIEALLNNQNGVFVDDTPAIRLPRPLQSVNFNYSVNGDKIILTPNEDNDRIENVELSIGVKNIKDLNGNRLSAPITWTAFVDRNDVVWLDDELDLEKQLNEPYSFEVEITNQGGQLRGFTISNLPAWLTASPASGTLEPTRSKTISFVVDEGLNIGEYDEFVHLTTDFGFDEKLSINLNVVKAPPADWTVDASDYQFSMSLVAALRVSGIFSRDKNDLIAAFVDGEVRGVAPLSYVSEFDQYQAFLSIYTNDDTGKDIVYKVWDASEGLVYTGIKLSDADAGVISPDAFFGSPAAPVTLSADRFLENTVTVGAGWNWVSFNLNSDDFGDVNALMQNFPATENDQLKGLEFFDQYDPVNGWLGSLSGSGGIQKERMYKLNVSNPGDITFVGSLIDVASAPIDLSVGWNWLSFFGRNNQSINEALSNISNLSVGDRIKGQREFAIYGGTGIGWVGSLSNLKPGEGYLYFANEAGTLTYPELSAGISNIGSTAGGRSLGNGDRSIDFESFGLNPADYETNMNLVVKVGPITVGSEDILVAKSDEKVVGLGSVASNPVTGEKTFFITVYGTTESPIEFELLKGDTIIALKAEQASPFSYRADTQLGSLIEPIMLISEQFLSESITAKAVPNPFEENIRLSWFAEAPPRSIQVMNTEGIVMQKLNNLYGNHQDIGFGGMAQGMYLIRLNFEQQVLVLKVVKSK